MSAPEIKHLVLRILAFGFLYSLVFIFPAAGCAQIGEGTWLGLLNSVASQSGTGLGDSAGTSPPADWWNGDWTRRRRLTFDNAARSENLDNFPVLVKLDSTRIDYTATQASGADLCFVDSDGTLLSHEIETWNTSGTSFVWVKVPRINASSSEDYMYVYYGGTGTCAQNKNDVWSAGYEGVWHLNQVGSDNHKFHGSAVRNPEIIHVSGDIYAVIYTNSTAVGKLKTIRVGSTGIIGAELSSADFDAANGENPVALKTGNGVITIAYLAAGGGTLKSFSVDTTTGAITGPGSTRVFDAAATGKLSFVNVSGTTHAVAYRGAAGDGFVTSMDIATDGTIGAPIASYEFDVNDAQTPALHNISGTTFAAAYHQGITGDGMLRTFTINADGTFGGVNIGSLNFDTSGSAFDFDFASVSGTTYAVVYQGLANDGFIKTFNIAADGTIAGVLNTLEFDTSNGIDPVISRVNGEIFAVAYEQTGGDGWIQTLRVTAAGAITKITTWEYNVSRGNYPALLTLNSGTVALVCACTTSHGFLYTMLVDSNGVLYDQLDSTSNNRHTQSAFTMDPVDQVTENIGGSLTFDGVNDGQFIVSPTLGANFSISMWVKPAATLGTVDGLIGAYNGTDGWRFRSGFGTGATGLTFSNSAANFDAPGGTLDLNTWQMLSVTYDGNIYRLYKNGAEILASAGGQAAPLNKTYIVIGRLIGTSYEFPGTIDETRIAAATHSAFWISAQYASQADSLISFGSETSL